ncbi:TraV family lipoprotein [Sphingomonas sp. ID1715]|uniref:TraV family lipoprotein n=1 Tax=Sphingomonas sp. ID1715 TaxID=1656898 RepID=UPI0014891574|nr:TraV family lipoprotein [Sphingomonas sp. ID1715]NNM77679.1 TraV family lipoprotein [Sphingomonas sp. ID1715]
MIARLSLLSATALVAGCTTLGGNIKGAFTCRAPAGTCAPTSTIDAKAVDHDAADDVPASATGRSHPLVAGTIAGTAVRSAERTIAIVFPPYVDEAGVLHDQAVAHAVVEPPHWAASPADPHSFSRSPAPSSLREVVAGASASAAEGLEPSPSQAPHQIDSFSSRSLAPLLRGTVTGASAPVAEGLEPLPTQAPHSIADGTGAPTVEAIAAARAGHRIERPDPSVARPPRAVVAPGLKRALEQTRAPAAAEEKVRKALAPLMTKANPEPVLDDPFRPAQTPGGGK